MNESFGLVGRFATLHSLVSKPELNGRSVFVGLYNPETQRFATSTAPVQGSAPISIAVKQGNLEFTFDTSFGHKYPNTPVVVGAFDQPVVAGTIVEFSECPEYNKKTPSWLLKVPVLVRGPVAQPNELGLSLVQFNRTVVVSMEEGLNEPIEFNNINFDIPSKENSVHISRGRNVTFRKCSFKSLGHGISIGDRNRLGDNAGKASVLFVECVFEASVGAGVIIAGDGHATLRHCRFRGNSKGIVVKDGGTAVLVGCVIEEAAVGIHLHAQGRSVDLLDCSVQNCANGVMVDGGTARAQNLTVSGSSVSGVDIHGGAPSTTVTMEHSSVTHCAQGVVAHSGKVKVVLNSCKVCENSTSGLLVDDSAVGEVKLVNCVVEENEDENIVRTGNEKCVLLVDGQ